MLSGIFPSNFCPKSRARPKNSKQLGDFGGRIFPILVNHILGLLVIVFFNVFFLCPRVREERKLMTLMSRKD